MSHGSHIWNSGENQEPSWCSWRTLENMSRSPVRDAIPTCWVSFISHSFLLVLIKIFRIPTPWSPDELPKLSLYETYKVGGVWVWRYWISQLSGKIDVGVINWFYSVEAGKEYLHLNDLLNFFNVSGFSEKVQILMVTHRFSTFEQLWIIVFCDGVQKFPKHLQGMTSKGWRTLNILQDLQAGNIKKVHNKSGSMIFISSVKSDVWRQSVWRWFIVMSFNDRRLI